MQIATWELLASPVVGFLVGYSLLMMRLSVVMTSLLTYDDASAFGVEALTMPAGTLPAWLAALAGGALAAGQPRAAYWVALFSASLTSWSAYLASALHAWSPRGIAFMAAAVAGTLAFMGAFAVGSPVAGLIIVSVLSFAGWWGMRDAARTKLEAAKRVAKKNVDYFPPKK